MNYSSILYVAGYKFPERLCEFQNLKWSEVFFIQDRDGVIFVSRNKAYDILDKTRILLLIARYNIGFSIYNILIMFHV